jgi:hypothetical protein
METATARMIEKNVFMVLKVSLPLARVRLPIFAAIGVSNELRAVALHPFLGSQLVSQVQILSPRPVSRKQHKFRRFSEIVCVTRRGKNAVIADYM